MKITNRSSSYILIYVDDIIITGSSTSDINTLITQLKATFSLKDLGHLTYFLGGLFLSQENYISDLQAKMSEVDVITTPMISYLILSATGSEYLENPHLYRSIIGALQNAKIIPLARS